MKKDWLARAEANMVRNGGRRVTAWWARGFRQRPLVTDSAFQEPGEPYPGHWRRVPDHWPSSGAARRHAARAALDDLPDVWRQVLIGRDVHGRRDAQVATELGLSVEQVRDIVANARAAVRDRLAAARPPGDEQCPP